MRGRGISFEVLPLSFAEFLSFQDLPTDIPVSSKDRALVGRAFDRYCLWGCRIPDPGVLKYLLKRLIGSFTKEFSVNKLYNDLKSRGFSTSKDSLYRMMDDVFAIYMMARVERYDPAVVRRELSNKKVYLFDNGLASAMDHLPRAEALLLVESAQPGLELPKWIRILPISEWLLE